MCAIGEAGVAEVGEVANVLVVAMREQGGKHVMTLIVPGASGHVCALRRRRLPCLPEANGGSLRGSARLG